MMVLTYAKKHVSKAETILKKAQELDRMVVKNFGANSYYGQKLAQLTAAAAECVTAMQDMQEHIEAANPRSRSRK